MRDEVCSQKLGFKLASSRLGQRGGVRVWAPGCERQGDLAAARAARPVLLAITHSRLSAAHKEVLVLQGLIRHAAVRPPQLPVESIASQGLEHGCAARLDRPRVAVA